MASRSSSALDAPLLDSLPVPGSKPALRKIWSWILLVLIWIAFLAWILVLIAFPTIRLGPGSSSASKPPALGTGLVLLLFALPLFLTVILATVYLDVRIKAASNGRKTQSRISLWTCPCLVDGLLGVVSAAEVLLIVAFIGFLAWCMVVYWIHDKELVERFIELPQIRAKFLVWELWTYVVGLRIGFLGLFCIGFLFLPVSRGSPLLRLIDIPFEHAVKYHVWLGHLTMAIFTIHGLCYIVVWTAQGRLEELLAWQSIGVANLPGVISLVAGWFLWMTSFGYVRQRFFELFFYTHHLYVVFIVFMAFHIGDLSFCISMAGIFLFMLDRFLRFCQSRRSVDLLISRVLPCGTIELVFSKPQGLKYNALSFVFMSVPKISFLQWHPFSVSSSPYDARENMSFLIKPLGSWTEELQDLVEKSSKGFKCPLLGIEGPYGHESDYYLKYDALVLVAGGIGVSPFVAVLRDLMHRLNVNHDNLPREVTLIWAVKYSKELSLINLVQPESICPYYSLRLKLTILTYVTREPHQDTENAIPPLPEHILTLAKQPDCKPISTLVGTYSNFWMGVYMAVSIAGLFLVQSSLEAFFLGPFTFPEEGGTTANSNSSSISWTVRAAILLLSMLCGVILFGGVVIACWNWIESSRKGRKSLPSQDNILQGGVEKVGVAASSLVGPWNTVYGERPDLQELFNDFEKKWSGINVGVLVCGPPSLQTSVATACRSKNVKLGALATAFHYHSVSFDL